MEWIQVPHDDPNLGVVMAGESLAMLTQMAYLVLLSLVLHRFCIPRLPLWAAVPLIKPTQARKRARGLTRTKNCNFGAKFFHEPISRALFVPR